MDLKTITCPNCGANTTNPKNCEYCGSLLVRFIDKHIEIDQNRYGRTAEQLTGLEQALKANLKEQEDSEGTYHVKTSIRSPLMSSEIHVCNPKAINDYIDYSIYFDEVKIGWYTMPKSSIQSENISLLVCFRFFEMHWSDFAIFYPQTIEYLTKLNKENKIQLERFMQMKEFPLFTPTEESLYNMKGIHCGTVYSYYIDFGQDYKGAAAIITQYMREVQGVRAIKKVDFKYKLTSVRDEEYEENIEEIRFNRILWKLGMIFCGLFCLLGGVCALFNREMLLIYWIYWPVTIFGAILLYKALK